MNPLTLSQKTHRKIQISYKTIRKNKRKEAINMPGIFGNLFDFNRDGKLDALEHGIEFMALQQMMDADKENEDDIDDLEFDEILDD